MRVTERVIHNRTQLKRLVNLSRLAATHYRNIENENLRISRDFGQVSKAWGYWNSNWRQEEQNFIAVLPEGFESLITKTRQQHNQHDGQIVALTFGSNNSPLDGLLETRDIQIAVSLQDLRSQDEIEIDTQRGFYLVTGTIGDPFVWRKLKQLFSKLYLANKIKVKGANIIIDGMKAGWETLPLDITSVHYLEQELGLKHQDIDDETFLVYRNWIEHNIWSVANPQAATIITDAPAQFHAENSKLQERFPSGRRHRVYYHGDGDMRSRIRIERRGTFGDNQIEETEFVT